MIESMGEWNSLARLGRVIPLGAVISDSRYRRHRPLTVINNNGATVINKNFGKSLDTSFEALEIFQIGGVIFF